MEFAQKKKIIFMGTFLLVHKYLERFSFVKIKLSQIENANKLLFFSSPTPHPSFITPWAPRAADGS